MIDSVGIDLKELGVGVRCRSFWNFAQRLKFKANFHSKMKTKKLLIENFPSTTSRLIDW